MIRAASPTDVFYYGDNLDAPWADYGERK